MERAAWPEGLPIAITVTSADGTILEMNPRSRETFAADGGAALIGSNVVACHVGRAREKTEALFASHQANHYTIRKNGQRKMIHQLPWFDAEGRFAGYVELSIPIPDDLPEHVR